MLICSPACCLDQRINAKLEQIMQLRSLSQRYTVAFGGEHVSHIRNIKKSATNVNIVCGHLLVDSFAKLIYRAKSFDNRIAILFNGSMYNIFKSLSSKCTNALRLIVGREPRCIACLAINEF